MCGSTEPWFERSSSRFNRHGRNEQRVLWPKGGPAGIQDDPLTLIAPLLSGLMRTLSGDADNFGGGGGTSGLIAAVIFEF